ncbi:hypothetical protein HFP15_16140 [Amycolatopsis sp. K13G38]|uniref:DUF2637 domain-containing protein n=1 Tax=Amycolatopsis acididurans TaxID=2724524 RepID=A0ABX1J3R5_9PSEU|nr:hypothetical protein [Amycolatopsis acididurans]NKQ54413.1 hypothetical protein [Amycolatopsis acididurans]
MTSTETVTAPQDARHVPLSTAEKLRQDAEAAAQVRALSNHPDVIALRVEKVRSFVDSLVWVGIFLGLAFTMVNVQTFAAAGARPWSLAWLAAWLLDPMVSLVLVAVLRAEQITARYQVQTGVWPHRTKWFAFLATYVMNTWQSWAVLHPAGVVLHSVPPVLVFLAAETAPVLRDRLTESVHAAAADRADRGRASGVSTGATPPVNTPPHAPTTPFTNYMNVVQEPVPERVHDTPPAPVHEPTSPPVHRPTRSSVSKPKARAGAGRKLLGDYVAEARAAWAPGIEITPAWVRQVVPEVSRGTSKNVADTLRAEITPAPVPTVQPSPEPESARREEAA